MADYIRYESTGKPHPFHILKPSPWPMLASFAAGFLCVMAVLYFHETEIFGIRPGLWGVALGLAAVLGVSFFWFRDIVRESVIEKAHTTEAETGFRWGMALFIASEVMFFFAFFWAFFDASLFTNQDILFSRLEYSGGQWPPEGVEVIHPFDVPFLMTLILLLSGCSVTWAHHAVQAGKRDELVRALAITVFLGFFFMCFQVYEYTHAEFAFDEGVYAATFYMATGFHGAHVLIGTIFLAVCLFRAMKGHFTPERHFGFEAAAWYWNFVDVVWLFLFIAVYWWGNLIGVGSGSS